MPQAHVDSGGVTRTVMRGAERQMAVRVAHARAHAVSQEQLADGRTSIVFRAPAPDKVVVNHIDNERRDLLTATPEPTGTDGEWRVDAGPRLAADAGYQLHVVRRGHAAAAASGCGTRTAVVADPRPAGDGDVAGRGGQARPGRAGSPRAPAASWS